MSCQVLRQAAGPGGSGVPLAVTVKKGAIVVLGCPTPGATRVAIKGILAPPTLVIFLYFLYSTFITADFGLSPWPRTEAHV